MRNFLRAAAVTIMLIVGPAYCMTELPYSRERSPLGKIIMDYPSLSLSDRLRLCRQNLESKADVNERYNDKTPLDHAVGMGYENIVALLLSFGADPSKRDVFGSTPLHVACHLGHQEVVRVIMESSWCNQVIEFTDRMGMTALQLAVRESHAGCVAMLIQYDAAIAELLCDPLALHNAVAMNCSLLVKALLGKGVALDEMDPLGIPALFYACRHGFNRIIHDALESTRAEEILQLRDAKGNSLLREAIKSGQPVATQMLIDKGALQTDNSENLIRIASACFEAETNKDLRIRYGAVLCILQNNAQREDSESYLQVNDQLRRWASDSDISPQNEGEIDSLLARPQAPGSAILPGRVQQVQGKARSQKIRRALGSFFSHGKN